MVSLAPVADLSNVLAFCLQQSLIHTTSLLPQCAEVLALFLAAGGTYMMLSDITLLYIEQHCYVIYFSLHGFAIWDI